MAEYRAYPVGSDGHFIGFRAYICESDTDAIVWAKQLADGLAIELWSGERFVTRLSGDPTG